ncbi:SDR family NAD(P)-dependent oxidoreductase [Andreprevotia chitinilytica]|uniref:SDR family NAD(P)-dependent oxidoreductase n=1 Tax=Andreprevotia chitinilytica TaxID=396808 RepID=UPI0006908873|nr:SDR family NAD(P)-dependent oxidoreductase [Andreprevotia chitinilytica]
MKLALITGGSHGLGAALVALYQQRGWHVLELSRSGQGEAHVSVDMADPAQTLAVIQPLFTDLAGQAWDEIALINNAGVLTPLLLVTRLDAAAITANLNVNLLTAIHLITAFVQAFDTHPCRKTIVQISSGAGQRGYGSWSLYCAGKAGMDNFIRALAVEQAQAIQPFTCISVDPDVMDTRMQGEIRSTSATDFPDVGRFIARKKHGKLRTPESVAEFIAAVVACAENGARYDMEDGLPNLINGQEEDA